MSAIRVAIALVLTLQASAALSWGDEGHRITGYVANSALTASTRAKLREVLGTDDLATVATWMDDQRDLLDREIPGSSRWHYENRAACSTSTADKKRCPQGNCVTHQIERLRSLLSNPQLSREQRARTVRMLVHLIGDLHQPLHLADNRDRGGNDVWVYVGTDRDTSRLHAVWDTRFVRFSLRRKPEFAFARELIEKYRINLTTWQQGNVDTWASESYLLGKQSVYATLPNFSCGNSITRPIRLDNEYIENAKITVQEQLTKAGLRIAAVLNQSLN
jgi:hypothetical protein